MQLLVRSVRSVVLALAAASMLASCKDEGGVLDVFFWARGSGDCERIVVTIDMQSADAILGPIIEGEEDCALYNALEQKGCDFEVEELDEGFLRVTIDDCRIGDHSGLFRCGFSDGELEAIELHTSAACECFGPSCDETPSLCVSDDSENTTCEIESSSTTSTSSTSTSFGNSTQPTMSTTSTTGIPDPPAERYIVKFGVDNGSGVGALQFDIHYAALAASFARSANALASDPECTKLVPSAFASFQDDETEDVVHVSMANLPGTAGSLELVECSFQVNAEPGEDDFVVNVLQALDLQGEPIGSPPPVEIGDISPAPTTTTTVEGATTTTFDAGTTTTLDGTTTTTVAFPVTGYDVTFVLETASANVAAIQWTTDYSSATGGIQGSGSGSSCVSLVSDTLFADNDKDRVCSGDNTKVCDEASDCTGRGSCTTVLEQLTLGMISLDSFPAPADLVRCTFEGSVEDPPVPADFDIEIEDATDVNGDPISVSLSVTVTPQ